MSEEPEGQMTVGHISGYVYIPNICVKCLRLHRLEHTLDEYSGVDVRRDDVRLPVFVQLCSRERVL